MNRLIKITTAAFGMLLCATSLASACVLTGTVVNQRSGSPIKDARVMLMGIVPPPMATTDANGAYSLATAYEPGASYTLQFQASGYALGNMPISLEIWRNQCRVTPGEDNGGTVEPADLTPLYTITGNVHTNSGLPVKGVNIKLTNDAIDDNSIAHAYENHVHADVHGSFNFAAPMGAYTLEFQAAGYAPKQIGITLGDNTAARMDVALKPLDSAKQRSNSPGASTPTIATSLGSAQIQTSVPDDCTISGHVQMTSGAPIKGAVVIVEGVRDAWRCCATQA